MEFLELDQTVDINQVINELKKNQDVEYAHPNYKLFTNALPNDQQFSQQWGLLNSGQVISGQAGTPGIDINILEAWNITKGRPDVLIGVLDSGIDINHIDLKSNIFVNTKEIIGNGIDDDNNGYVEDISGWNLLNDNNSVYESSSLDMHGTHIAGIIAAAANDEGISGVAPNVIILPLKFISGTSGYTSDAIEAIEYAKTLGIKILNCSWGGTDYNPALKDAMQNAGILFVCAAGNSAADVSTAPIYPACLICPILFQ